MHRTSLMAALAIAIMPHCGAYAKIKTAPLIAPGMVIQQNSDVRLSGTTTRKGATIKIKASWDRRTLKCKADDDGRWTVTIHTPQADHKSHTLTLDDGEPLTIDDVLVGEVWLASGQSNMGIRQLPRGVQPRDNTPGRREPRRAPLHRTQDTELAACRLVRRTVDEV